MHFYVPPPNLKLTLSSRDDALSLYLEVTQQNKNCRKHNILLCELYPYL